MPSLNKSILILATITQAAFVLAAPIPQLAGEGNACSSILSSTDNGIGYGIENAEDNTAALIKSGKVGRRQLAGEGNACSSILSSTDNGVGYGVKNAEDNTAALISSSTKPKRQADKIANGAADILSALGQNDLAQIEKNNGDTIDGQLTDDASSAGAQIGAYEEKTLEGIGKAIPRVKRQGDKIANGAADLISAMGQNDLAEIEKSNGDTLDGQLTDDATNAGAQVGAFEESTLENLGKMIPK
ncbi:hypothetical protein D6D17_08217 [Aureobasidium pullulans]|nr:hypothetical protein D6D17_08217 [Aureobasidium pullulans]